MVFNYKHGSNNSKAHSGMRHVTFYLQVETVELLTKLALIENIPKEKLMERLINTHVPIPAVLKEGDFTCIYAREVQQLQRIHPYAVVASLNKNSKIGWSSENYKLWKDDKISWEELKRKYVERLNMPDAIEEIARLRELKKSQDIYIMSFERIEEFSSRRLFCDYVNGFLKWK